MRTSPTALRPARAVRVAEAIHATAPRGGAPLHLIGHASGALDVRLLTAPGVGLPTALDAEQRAARVRTVVIASTPHHGDADRLLLHDPALPAAYAPRANKATSRK